MSALDLFKSAKAKRQEFAQKALDFTEDNRGAFVFLADPDTDVMFAAYRGIQIPIRFTDPKTEQRLYIVRDALNYQKSKEGTRSVDQFLLVVDSALVNIAEALYNRRRKSFTGRIKDTVLEFVGRPTDTMQTIEGIPSPFQVKH